MLQFISTRPGINQARNETGAKELMVKLRRFVESFVLFYFILLGFKWIAFVFDDGIGSLEDSYNHVRAPAVQLLCKTIFKMDFSIIEGTSSGDTCFDYGLCFTIAFFSMMLAGLLTILDKGEQTLEIARKSVRVYVRITLALVMFLYGMDKVLCIQMGSSNPFTLMQPIGEHTPMGLLWAFMAASKPLSIAAGAVEVLIGLLLLSERTTCLASCLGTAVMSQVLMLNLCYDVPVKLGCLNIICMFGFLLLPDLKRLFAFFLGKPVEPPAVCSLFKHSTYNHAFDGAQLLVGIFALVHLCATDWQHMHNEIFTFPKRCAYYGGWKVEKESHGDWEYVFFDAPGAIHIKNRDGSVQKLDVILSEDQRTMTVKRSSPLRPSSWRIIQQSQDRISIQGLLDNEPVALGLERIDFTKCALLSRKFRWITDTPELRKDDGVTQ